MRIKHNFIKISILQPERRFNNNSYRSKVVQLISELNTQPLLLSELISNAKTKFNFDEKIILSVISKLKGCGYISLDKIITEEENI